MKELLRKQRELCFEAWAENKSKKFPKHLWNHYYDVILQAKEPEYKEPLGIELVLIGLAIGTAIGVGVGYLIF